MGNYPADFKNQEKTEMKGKRNLRLNLGYSKLGPVVINCWLKKSSEDVTTETSSVQFNCSQVWQSSKAEKSKMRILLMKLRVGKR